MLFPKLTSPCTCRVYYSASVDTKGMQKECNHRRHIATAVRSEHFLVATCGFRHTELLGSGLHRAAAKIKSRMWWSACHLRCASTHLVRSRTPPRLLCASTTSGSRTQLLLRQSGAPQCMCLGMQYVKQIASDSSTLNGLNEDTAVHLPTGCACNLTWPDNIPQLHS